ncbi:unnamed protein product [Cochlearia groenlandica]
MAPRGRKPKVGLRREDAARDNMRQFGFEERVINKTIKELVQLYGEDGWKLIEDGGYDVLLTRCLEIQEEEAKQVSQVEQEESPQEEETRGGDRNTDLSGRCGDHSITRLLRTRCLEFTMWMAKQRGGGGGRDKSR